jgi:hypothetical protein
MSGTSIKLMRRCLLGGPMEFVAIAAGADALAAASEAVFVSIRVSAAAGAVAFGTVRGKRAAMDAANARRWGESLTLSASRE